MSGAVGRFGDGNMSMGVLASSQDYVSAAQSRLRVLVLDDDAFDRKRLRRWIESSAAAQVVLHEAADLNGFADQIARHHFDIVLLDYVLPDGTGIDALRMLRAHAANAASYAVMVSGQSDDTFCRSSLLAGCDQYMEKSALDAGRIANLLRAATTRSLEAPVVPVAAGQSALDYWARRGELRARRDRPEERARNLSLLQDALGLPSAPPPALLRKAPAAALPDEMSQALRLFILDFLACDTFEFISHGSANARDGEAS